MEWSTRTYNFFYPLLSLLISTLLVACSEHENSYAKPPFIALLISQSSAFGSDYKTFYFGIQGGQYLEFVEYQSNGLISKYRRAHYSSTPNYQSLLEGCEQDTPDSQGAEVDVISEIQPASLQVFSVQDGDTTPLHRCRFDLAFYDTWFKRQETSIFDLAASSSVKPGMYLLAEPYLGGGSADFDLDAHSDLEELSTVVANPYQFKLMSDSATLAALSKQPGHVYLIKFNAHLYAVHQYKYSRQDLNNN